MITFRNLGKMGRLGNQLFQIAATVSLAIKNNDNYGFPHWESERFFNLKNCFHNSFSIKKTYSEPNFHYNLIPYHPDMDLSGFFQSEKYFIDHKDLIIKLLSPQINVSPEDGLCGIHVRRGDYVNNPSHTNLDMSYYNNAMSAIRASKYLIFSDDINWCKKIFQGPQFEFSENKSVYEDLALMSKKCEHMIIANSSLSWWGAYLNNNPDKVIIAPQNWFGPALRSHNIKDLLPEDWIKI